MVGVGNKIKLIDHEAINPNCIGRICVVTKVVPDNGNLVVSDNKHKGMLVGRGEYVSVLSDKNCRYCNGTGRITMLTWSVDCLECEG